MTTPHLSELDFNRYLAGECPPERQSWCVHLEACASCQALLEHIQATDTDFLEPGPPAWLATLHSTAPVVPLSPHRLWKPLLAAAAAVVLLVGSWWWTRVEDPARPAAQNEASNDGIRIKGAPMVVEVYAYDGKQSRRAHDGARVKPGEKLGFRLRIERPGYAMIVGVDDTDTPYLCFPLRSREAYRFPEPVEGFEPKHSMRLDATPGRERIISVFCPHPFGFDDVTNALRDSSTSPLDGCMRSEIVLHK